MTSEKLIEKLGVWGKDKIIGENGNYHAGDYYCIRCYRDENLVRAEKFWPCMDIDIRDFPYCSPCISDLDMEVMMSLTEEEKTIK